MNLLRSALDTLELCSYFILGRKPFALGYRAYKKRLITTTLRRATFTTAGLPAGYGRGVDERIVEYPWLFSRLPSSQGRLLDAGSVLNYDFILTHPALAVKKVFICTVAPEARCYWRRGVSYVYDDLRDTCFRENYFDWVVCLSTLEHIGLDNVRFYAPGTPPEDDPDSHLRAVREFARILKPGGTLYLSVPCGRHVNHGWFQVFDLGMLEGVREAFRPASCVERYFVADATGWRVASPEDAAAASYYDRHAFKDFSPSVPAAAGAVACVELQK
jgi:SAM-dependent methyltransferase